MYTVSVYNAQAECWLTFGPFKKEELDDFYGKLTEANGNLRRYIDIVVTYVNDPKTFNTTEAIGS